MATPVLKEQSFSAAVAKLQRAALGLNTKTIKILLTDPRAAAAIVTDSNDGLMYLPIDVSLNGFELTTYILELSTRSSSGSVTVMARRDRAGTVVDMATTAASIDVSEDSSSSGVAPTMSATNKLVATDDRIWFKIISAGTGAKGLSVTLIFTEV